MPTIKLTTEAFKEQIFNYDTNQDWAYKGSANFRRTCWWIRRQDQYL